jgi:hypothetical protein
MLLMVATAGSAVANLATMANRSPGYGVGFAGVVLGAMSLAIFSSDADNRVAFATIGGVALATGLLACWDRHALDSGAPKRLELLPTWDRRDDENVVGAMFRIRF